MSVSVFGEDESEVYVERRGTSQGNNPTPIGKRCNWETLSKFNCSFIIHKIIILRKFASTRTSVAVGFSAVQLTFNCNHYCSRQIAV